jgi:hypothetical protein
MGQTLRRVAVTSVIAAMVASVPAAAIAAPLTDQQRAERQWLDPRFLADRLDRRRGLGVRRDGGGP